MSLPAARTATTPGSDSAALTAAEQRLSDFQGSAADLLHQLPVGWWEQIGKTRMAGVTKLIACESQNFPEVAQYGRDRVISRGRALEVDSAIDAIIARLLMLAISRFALCFCARTTTPETYRQPHFELLVHGLRRADGVPGSPATEAGW